MCSCHGSWMYVATALILGGVLSGQEDRAEGRNRGEVREAAPPVEGISLVKRGQAGWRYLDTRKAPPATWIRPDFDDSRWKAGRAPLGYGEDDVATALDYGGDEEFKHPAAFFRRKFNVKEAAEVYAGRIRADDGAVIHLNGKEIHRLRVAPGEIDYAEYSSRVLATGTAGERDFALFRVDSRAVVQGENVLCISVHQSSGTSSDLILDMELLGVSKKVFADLEKADRKVRERQAAALRLVEEDEDKLGGARLAVYIKEQLADLLRQLGESVGRRYTLGETAVEGLQQSIRDTVERMLEQDDGARVFGTPARQGRQSLLEALLSQAESKAAFAKHLNEKQLQDYLDFTSARAQRDRQAVDRQLVACLDQELGLTADQRARIEQVLGSRAAGAGLRSERGTTAIGVLSTMDPQEQRSLVRRRLRGRTDGILSEAQAGILKLLAAEPASTEGRWEVGADRRRAADGLDDEEGILLLRRHLAELEEAIDAGRVTREQAAERIEILSKRLGRAAGSVDRDGQENMRLLVAAKLAVCTEQLGPLEASAVRRLALVSKGVVEQYLESREERGATGSGRDVTSHPLYQQTIERVLSDEALARYKARQAARIAFRCRSLRALAVASLDSQLWLDERQRKHFEEALAKLSDPQATATVSAPVQLLTELIKRADRTVLGPIQQERIGEIVGEFTDLVELDDEEEDGNRNRRRRK